MVSKLLGFLKGNTTKEDALVKVYSHPRSGTHFLEAFLAENFYSKKDLSIIPIRWGHWSNRKIKEEGNPYGLLFGSHMLPSNELISGPLLYIARDPRAVVYSIWKTPNFIHKDKNPSLSEFLDMKMDWCGSPGSKFNCDETIIEHWLSHVKEWEVFCNSHKEALFVHYEDLIENPFEVYLSIRNIFFKHSALMESNELDVISKPLGLLPNAGTSNSWNNKYTDTDLEKFTTLIPTEYQNRFFTK